MSRVRSVVNDTIMVHIHDLKVNDIIATKNIEGDPIIDWIERDGDKVRLHYKDRPPPTDIQKELGIDPVTKTNWMDPHRTGAYVFIHDLHNERGTL